MLPPSECQSPPVEKRPVTDVHTDALFTNSVRKSRHLKTTNLGQLLDDHWDQSSIDHSLDLLLVSCCNVGQEPNSFLQIKPIA